MLLVDWQIAELATLGMITPFIDHQVRDGKISAGLSSVGYDMRLDRTFMRARQMPGGLLDPKNPDSATWVTYAADDFIDIPAGTFVLANSLEHWAIPQNIAVMVTGKSTYARIGLIVNVTPMEPGWKGYLTIEISNTGPVPARVYVGEGIAQACFHMIDTPKVTYNQRKGKYQEQPATPVQSKL